MTVYDNKLYVQFVESDSAEERKELFSRIEAELALRISCHDPDRDRRMYVGYDYRVSFFDLCKAVKRARKSNQVIRVFVKNTAGDYEVFIVGDERHVK